MRKLILAAIFQVLVLFLIAQSKTQAPALNPKDVIGVWQGYYEQSGINKSMTLEFKEVNGQLECYIDLPDRGLKSASFKIRFCPAQDFHLERTSREKTALMDNTYITFVGKPDGDGITGHYKFGNSCTPGAAPSFRLSRGGGF